jgi:hypothetical protein
MTEQTQTRIGTVAEEAARLIEDMAAMARSRSSRSQDPTLEAHAPEVADAPPGTSSAGGCAHCGGGPVGTPEACRLCPLCRGIALLRSVRPEIVEQLADLSSVVTECLRDMVAQSRASGSASSTRPASGSPSDGGRTTQDIPVHDESEG